MTTKNTNFKTSFGSEIQFVPGHFEFHAETVGLKEEPFKDIQIASINAAGGNEHLDYDKVAEILKEDKVEISIHGYGARLIRVYQFLRMLQSTTEKQTFNKSLDIGTGIALQPRIMKGLGLTKESVGIDIYDRSTAVSERQLAKRHRQFKRLRYLDKFRNRAESVPVEKRNWWQNAVMTDTAASARYSIRRGVGCFADDGIYDLKLKRPPHLDRYLNENIFDLEEKFDLLTSYSSLEWFKAPTIIKKCADLLEEGGLFYFWVPNWWGGVNTTLTSGHFPYASQRMKKEDYFRYLDENLGNFSETWKSSYNYFDPTFPTMNDYLNVCFENGLMPLDYRPLIKPDQAHHRTGVNPVGNFMQDFEGMQRVLSEIQEFRPDVQMHDLMPSSHAFLFKKVSKTSAMSEKTVMEWKAGMDISHNLTPPAVRRLGRLAVKYLKSK